MTTRTTVPLRSAVRHVLGSGGADCVVVRQPGDGIRAAAGFAVFVALSAVVWGAATVSKLSMLVTQASRQIPIGISWFLDGIVLVGTPFILIPVGAILALAMQRLRLARDLALAGILASVFAAALHPFFSWLTDDTLAESGAYPVVVTTSIIAVMIAVGPYLTRRVQHFLWAGTIAIVAADYFVNHPFFYNMLGAMALGFFVGNAVRFAFGTPIEQLSATSISAALRAVGIDTDPDDYELVASRRAGTREYVSRRVGREPLFVKIEGRAHHDTDWLHKLWRLFALRTVEDEPLFGTPKQLVEREAFVSILAQRNGVRVPRIVGATATAWDETILVMDMLRGTSLDRMRPGDVSDDMLIDLWRQVAALHACGVAHRDLRHINFFVDDDDDVWIVDFGFAQFAASDRKIAQDVAQCLGSLAEFVGAERAVATAAAVVGHSTLESALRYLTRTGLAITARRSFKARKPLIARLRRSLASEIGADADVTERVGRVQIKTLIGIVGLGAAIYVIWPNLVSGEFRETLESWQGDDWIFIGIAGIFAIGTYFTAALQVHGTVPGKLSFKWTLVSQVASDFMNVLAPAGLGGMGLIAAFVYKAGYTKTQAGVAVSLRTVTSVISHVLTLAVFVLIVGTQGTQLFDVGTPKPWFIAIIAGFVALGVAAFTWPKTRHWIITPIRDGFRELRKISRQRTRVIQLMTGSFGILACYALAFYMSLLAFKADVSFVVAVTIWLGGSIVILVWPVPGGVGGVELIMTAALVRAGVDPGTALAAVLTFRLLTFWLPIIPGYPAYRILERYGKV